jgi:hypothetical protein
MTTASRSSPAHIAVVCLGGNVAMTKAIGEPGGLSGRGPGSNS